MNIPAWLTASASCLGTIESPLRSVPLAEREIREALDRPVWPDGGAATVFEVVRPGESVCLVIADYTRKTAADRVLPALLSGFSARGCDPGDMFFLVASGIHRRTTEAETERIVGPAVYRKFRGRIFHHDPDDTGGLVTVGVTKRGHPVAVNRRAIEAGRRILLGAASYHYHAGFGGGRKLLVPGLASRATIAYNHSLTLDPEADRVHPMATPGILDGNPVAEEMLECARLCRPDISINTVLDAEGELIGLFSGELDAAHRAACRLVEKVARVDIRERADLVVASDAGAPNWIQAHKALFNAHRAAKAETGQIVLVAPCPDGLGDERFRYWVKKADATEICRELRLSPEVYGQTALSTHIRGRRAILVTQLAPRDIADLGLRSAPDLEAALRLALASLPAGRKPTYYLMPRAAQTLPFVVP